MTRKTTLVILSIVLGIAGLRAQQLPQHTQYMFNDFLLNPAVTGTKDHYQAISNNRYQWVGFIDAPRTYVLSVYGPHKSKNMGFGGYAYNDVTAQTSRLGVNLSYAYQFKVSDDVKISLGLSGGFLQYKIDATQITFHEEDDPAIQNVMYADYLPDANFGVYAYGSKWFAGISANQLLFFYNKVKLYDVRDSSNTELKTHAFAYGGYKFNINDKFMIVPSALIKYVYPAPVQFEINTKFVFKQDLWAGVSYRHADAVSFMIGYEILKQVYLGYSYDLSITPIRNHSSGTHEFMIGVRFNRVKEEESQLSLPGSE